MKKIGVAVVLAGSLLTSASSALAFDCVVENKPVGAGSAATVNIDTGVVTPSKPNPGTEDKPHGAFVTLTGTVGGTTLNVDTFVKAPTKAQAPFAEPGVIPGATKQESKGGGCDGKGLGTIEACLSG
jgi:hypothetical protein